MLIQYQYIVLHIALNCIIKYVYKDPRQILKIKNKSVRFLSENTQPYINLLIIEWPLKN